MCLYDLNVTHLCDLNDLQLNPYFLQCIYLGWWFVPDIWSGEPARRRNKLLCIMKNDFDKHWRSWQLIVLCMTPCVVSIPSLSATHQEISLGPEGECHVITSRVSCHVIFATACHNSGGAALVMVFITVCKQVPIRKLQHSAWLICGELWDM